MNMRCVKGFTLVELLVVVSIATVLAMLAAPSFNEQLARRRLEGVATELSVDMQYAKTQAVADRNSVQVVTDNGGTRYRILNAAGTPLKTVSLPAGITATDAVTVTYEQLRGTSNTAQILVADARTAAQLRIDTNPMGRVSLCSPGGSLKGYTSC